MIEHYYAVLHDWPRRVTPVGITWFKGLYETPPFAHRRKAKRTWHIIIICIYKNKCY